MISKLRKWVNKIEGTNGALLWFWCPGCEEAHAVEVESKKKSCWNWNGSEDCPTITPSVLCVQSQSERRCHSFVKDGKIQFLNDCFHKLKGQTVPLPELPDWLLD